MSDMTGGYFYLATPYTKYSTGLDAAFEDSCIIAAHLINMGLIVYSPIAHTHSIAKHGGVDPKNHDLWMAVEYPLVKAARGLIVAMLTGWENSVGVQKEIQLFREMGKPIFYLKPEDLPNDSIPLSSRSQENVVRFTDIPRTTFTEPID